MFLILTSGSEIPPKVIFVLFISENHVLSQSYRAEFREDEDHVEFLFFESSRLCLREGTSELEALAFEVLATGF